ncbi:MAG: ribose-phosphate diphosphokinase [Mycoplasmataceae bacterium]|nr:ribose-phosphate diphosphokinase [Mycoplasmataceae bacterium]
MDDILIFGLSQSKKMAKSINDLLGLKNPGVKFTRFANGEMLTYPSTSVRGKIVYVIQSTSNPSSDSIMELLIFLDSLKRSSVKEVNVIIPFYGYARQDRKAKGRQPITAKLLADMLENVGINRLITVDLHSSQVQGFFDVPVDDLKGIYLIKEEIEKQKMDNMIVVSPDHGGINRARVLSNMLKTNLSILDKKRSKPNESRVLNVLGDPLDGKNAIIIDDMIDTGGTIYNTIKVAEELGAKSVSIFCTHGIFSNDGLYKITNEKIVKSIYMTNSIENKIPEYLEKTDKLRIISLDKLISKLIKAQTLNQSTSNIYDNIKIKK